MFRPLLTLSLLAGLATAARADDACPSISRSAGPPTYVILYGYPYDAPAETWAGLQEPLPELPSVDEDVMRMARLFQALGPRQMHIHSEPRRAMLARFSAFAIRPPTWRSLRQSAVEVAADIQRDADLGRASDARPQVYIYLAGHGRRIPAEHGGRLAFFGRPEGRGPGYDGVMHSAIFAEHILAPLAERARVHLIADTCFSYTLLQTRGMKRIRRVVRAPPAEFYDEAFGRDFPQVGAVLAGRDITYEGAERGGHFSHAVRSEAIGPADRDGDGVITYAEMDHALRRAALTDKTLLSPAIVPPGLDRSAPFIRWDQSPAAGVCASPGSPQRLYDGPDLFATVPALDEPTTLWLAPEHGFTISDEPFEAIDGTHLPRRP